LGETFLDELFTNLQLNRFGGVIGAAAMIIFLPLLVIMFAYACNREQGYSALGLVHFITHFDLSAITFAIKNWNYGAALFYLGIVAQLVVYSAALPGTEVEGIELRDGSKLKYKINAMTVFQSLITLSFMALRGQGFHLFIWTKAHFADISLFSFFFAFLVSGFVYARSFFGNKMLALGGNTGNPIYDVSCLCITTAYKIYTNQTSISS
jgi:hypothetical protein